MLRRDRDCRVRLPRMVYRNRDIKHPLLTTFVEKYGWGDGGTFGNLNKWKPFFDFCMIWCLNYVEFGNLVHLTPLF